ncbi:iron ABC transporter substrate-binding protein [Desulfogranum marinum]|uniref:iron ABC transporter substrate-binding protein n=1 Tax=Desulfogranum marinum TaxID=453220 RepID=UPI0029C7C819|nr:iron ABC transporter substrate-binding protein [Desulfogranum marinum]
MFTRIFLVACIFFLLCSEISAKAIEDSSGKTVQLPDSVDHVICSGSGCLRLLTYLQAQDKIVGVDSIETRKRKLDARPYALANPQFKKMPVFGEFRGYDNPERILTLAPQPQVIFKTYSSQMGYDPVELQQKTGIPVVVLNYGNFTHLRPELYKSLRIMGTVLGKENRSEQVISFFEETTTDLDKRTVNVPVDQRPTVYLGGVAFKGPHGFQSTEPAYPPFKFVHARNLAYDKAMSKKELSNSNIAKEKIVAWDPEYLFLDLSTLLLGDKAGGLYELKTDPAYLSLSSVKENRVFGLLPYNLYTKNYGSILANAYYIGKLLYPERFSDVDPDKKADEIYQFLVGKPVFSTMNGLFNNLVFKKVPLK